MASQNRLQDVDSRYNRRTSLDVSEELLLEYLAARSEANDPFWRLLNLLLDSNLVSIWSFGSQILETFLP